MRFPKAVKAPLCRTAPLPDTFSLVFGTSAPELGTFVPGARDNPSTMLLLTVGSAVGTLRHPRSSRGLMAVGAVVAQPLEMNADKLSRAA